MFYSRGGGGGRDLDCLLYPSLIFSVEITEPATSPVTSTVPPTPTSGSNQKEKKKKKKDPSKGRWVEGITSEGYHYYYDLITGGKSIRQKTVENDNYFVFGLSVNIGIFKQWKSISLHFCHNGKKIICPLKRCPSHSDSVSYLVKALIVGSLQIN